VPKTLESLLTAERLRIEGAISKVPSGLQGSYQALDERERP
jgi:hypothetical protein